jgi:2-dehydropantoate 2-reductase
MRVVVFGGGATGSLFAARLSGAKNDVTLIARPDHVEAIRSGGLHVEGFQGGVFRFDARGTVDGLEPPDALLLTVKTFDLETASAAIADAFSSPVPILLPQNGLGVEPPVARTLHAHGWPDRDQRLVRATHSIPVTFLGPGRVRQAGEGELLLSAHPPPELQAATDRFRNLLRSAGTPVRDVEEMDRELWRKSLINAAINPITADHGIANGRLSEDPWRGQALELLGEARTAAQLAGVQFTQQESELDLFRVVRLTATNHSSMLQDLERGRPTEIDSISGVILATGRAHGVELPGTRRAISRILVHVRTRDRFRPPQLS